MHRRHWMVVIMYAWVLWLEVYSPKGTEREPKGAFPDNSHQACLNEAKVLVDEHVQMFTSMKLPGVSRSSRGGVERVMAELKPGQYYHWTYTCLPDTIDPRQPK